MNPYICRLAGELCDGFLVHPFHSIKYIHETSCFPNVESGLAKSERTRARRHARDDGVRRSPGRTATRSSAHKAPVRQQIAFYASTRTYIGVLEAHGWGETCYRLNEKAAKGDWAGMASLITDEMLEVYAVQGTYDELPGLLRKKYTGVIDRLGFYALPGVLGDEAQRRGARRGLPRLVATSVGARGTSAGTRGDRRPSSGRTRSRARAPHGGS